MRNDIKRAVIVAVLASGLVTAVGCRAGETTDGGPRIGGPSSSPVAVTPRPPTVGGGAAPDGLLEPQPESDGVDVTDAIVRVTLNRHKDVFTRAGEGWGLLTRAEYAHA